MGLLFWSKNFLDTFIGSLQHAESKKKIFLNAAYTFFLRFPKGTVKGCTKELIFSNFKISLDQSNFD